MPSVIEAELGPPQETLAGAGKSKSNPGEPNVMVKLLFEISKKILPTDSTFILAVVVGTFGIVTDCEPSLGVLLASVYGHVFPPSVDNRMFTLAQLTGAAVVLFTVQVMVCADNPGHETAVLGAETPNGPEVLVTVTVISVNCVCPTVTGAVEL